MAIATTARPPLPAAIRRTLGAIDRRLRTYSFLGGTGRLLLVMAVTLVASAVLDFFVALPIFVRYALWAIWVAAGLFMLAQWIVRPLARRRRWDLLASYFDADRPNAHERVTSAVGLLANETTPHGSPQLIQALIEQAETYADSAQPTLVPLRRPASLLIAGLCASAAIALVAGAWPDPVSQLLRRFLMPWESVPRVALVLIEVEPGDATAVTGGDLAVSVRIRPRYGFVKHLPATAELAWWAADGVVHRMPLLERESSSAATRRFAGTLRGVPESLNYQIRSDDNHSRNFRLNVVDPPGTRAIAARIEPPAYTRRPALAQQDFVSLSAFEGSRVTLSILPNRPMRRVGVSWVSADAGKNSQTIELASHSAKDATWQCTFTAEHTGTLHIVHEDLNGLKNADPPRTLTVETDQPPQLALEGSDESHDTRPDDLLVVGVAASDDIAVAGADIVYQVQRGDAAASNATNAVALPIQLEGFGTSEARGQASLNLKRLGLRAGDEVVYEIAVRDNRPDPPGPHVTRSQPRRLRVRDGAEPLSQRLSRSRTEQLRARLERLRRAAAETHQATVGLRYVADAAQRGNGQWGQENNDGLRAQAEHARQTVEQLGELAREFEQITPFEPLAQPARQLADVEADGARQMLDRAREATEMRQRLADLRLADSRLDALKTRLDQLQRSFDELSRQSDDLQQLGALAEREEDLAQRAAEAQAAGASRAELEAMRQEQEALRNQVDDLVRRSPQLRAQAMKRQAEQADRLAQQAQKLAEQQRQEERKSADDRTRAARLAALAEEQQAIALEARKLALEIDAPLSENGRGRVNADALNRPVDPLKRGDTEPAMQQIEAASNELRRLAREIDEVRTDPKVAARRLQRRQEELAQKTAVILQAANTPDGRTGLAEKLATLQMQQAEIAHQAQALAPVVADRTNLDSAHAALRNAAEALKGENPDFTRQRQNEARDALSRLADAIPEAWQRRQLQQQAANEARGQIDAVARELEQHVRETANQAAANNDPVAAARELARRAEPFAQRQREAAKKLQAIEPTAEVSPQRDRAASKAQALAQQLEALTRAAPLETDAQSSPSPRRDWLVLGPFDLTAAPPFPFDHLPDPNTPAKDRQGRATTWKPVAAADQGTVDLHGLFGSGPDTQNASAFAVAELQRDNTGPARLLVGSDDTLTVWLDGKVIYDFQGRRSYAPAQDAIATTIPAGKHRLVMRCGNGDGDWKFSVAITPPASREALERLHAFEQQRDQLVPRAAQASTAVERLQQAIDGREPADRRAAELAQQMRDTAKAANGRTESHGQTASALSRVRAGVAALDAPDVSKSKADALQKLDQALSNAQDAKAPDPAALAGAAEAVDALARSFQGDSAPTPAQSNTTAPNAITDDRELGLDANHRTRADALRRRQREVSDALRTILAEGADSQHQVRQRATEVAQALEALRDEVRDLSQSGRAQNAAQAAVENLQNRSLPAMDRGASELAQGRLASGREAQRQAADAAEQAARHASDLAAALHADMPADAQGEPAQAQANESEGPSRGNLQSARASQAQASADLTKAVGQGNADQAKAATQSAASAMRSAAQGLRAAAAKGRGMGKQTAGAGASDPSVNPNPNGVGRAVGLHTGDLDPAQLANERRRWGELPGQLRDEMNQTDPGRYRDDYARLIRLYFREIADTEATKDTPAQPQEKQP